MAAITNLQFLGEITIASIVEYVGDASFKMYARLDSHFYLLLGIFSYIILVYMLIHILKYSNVLQMNVQWDAMSIILETLLAYILLAEILSEPEQFIGFFLIVSGLIVMNLGKSSYK
jgi:multidrug transporter EmrE-like cation transporter